MTARSPDAIAAALAMLRDPHLARLAQRSPLPKGMTLLLEVACGEAEALARAQSITGRSEETLRKGAGFFVEQVLLSRHSNNYRVLGATRDAPAAELRRHMALVLKWLHPDLFQGAAEGKSFNKSAYVNLVTEAWATLKTSERRAAYDAVLLDQERNAGKKSRGSNGKAGPLGANRGIGAPARHGQRVHTRRPVLFRPERDTFWNRLLSYIGMLR